MPELVSMVRLTLIPVVFTSTVMVPDNCRLSSPMIVGVPVAETAYPVSPMRRVRFESETSMVAPSTVIAAVTFSAATNISLCPDGSIDSSNVRSPEIAIYSVPLLSRIESVRLSPPKRCTPLTN